MRFTQETILAMELDRRHIGKLVQLITESWSLTGTLRSVDQHDNREWEIDYANGRGLVPSGGEIYSVLTIGPWTGRVIGNQPVTVETAHNTIAAPEDPDLAIRREGAEAPPAQLREFKTLTRRITDEEIRDARAVVEGTILEPGALEARLEDLPPEPPAEWHKYRD